MNNCAKLEIGACKMANSSVHFQPCRIWYLREIWASLNKTSLARLSWALSRSLARSSVLPRKEGKGASPSSPWPRCTLARGTSGQGSIFAGGEGGGAGWTKAKAGPGAAKGPGGVELSFTLSVLCRCTPHHNHPRPGGTRSSPVVHFTAENTNLGRRLSFPTAARAPSRPATAGGARPPLTRPPPAAPIGRREPRGPALQPPPSHLAPPPFSAAANQRAAPFLIGRAAAAERRTTWQPPGGSRRCRPRPAGRCLLLPLHPPAVGRARAAGAGGELGSARRVPLRGGGRGERYGRGRMQAARRALWPGCERWRMKVVVAAAALGAAVLFLLPAASRADERKKGPKVTAKVGLGPGGEGLGGPGWGGGGGWGEGLR